MTEKTLRVISVHSVAGGVGCSTMSMLLADYFSQQSPALVVEIEPRGASLVDGFQLLAPGWQEGDFSRAPDVYEDLPTTREKLTESDHNLPFLLDITAGDLEDVHPRAFGWRLADGNSGAGRVFVVPACASVYTVYDREAAMEAAMTLLACVAKRLDDEGAFGTVVLDFGAGLATSDDFSLDPRATLWLAANNVQIAWTPVVVATPQRAELRALGRALPRLNDIPYYSRAVYILNKCDSDVGALIQGVHRMEGRDLVDTLFCGSFSPLGRALLDRGAIIRTNPKLRWAYGEAFRSDGFFELTDAIKAIVKSEEDHG